MRLLLFLLAICVGIGIGTHAEAQNYPWCAAYSGGDTGGGGTNCGFTHFNNAWRLFVGLAAFASRIRNTSPHWVRIPARRKGAIHIERA